MTHHDTQPTTSDDASAESKETTYHVECPSCSFDEETDDRTKAAFLSAKHRDRSGHNAEVLPA